MATYRVPARIEYAAAGGPGYNVWHVRTTSDDPGQLSDALGALDDFYTSFQSSYANSTLITLGEGMIKDPLGTPTYVDDDPRTVGGTGGTSIGPTLLSVCVSWRTAVATRSGRGRTFLGPFIAGVNDATDGTPSAGGLEAYRDAAAALIAASGGVDGWAIGVLSVKDGVIRDITGATIRDKWSFLSSRRD